MKIDIITMWYNEEFLAPFFLKHYSFADTIHILLDKETTDNTKKITSEFDNIHVIPVKFPDMLDDIIKIQKINSFYRSLDSDWVIAVDSDEFIFTLPPDRDIREILGRQSEYNLLYAQMWQVFRHSTDIDLNPDQPAIFQRRHGDPNVSTGMNATYVKPIVVRSSLSFEWDTGCHRVMERKGLGKRWDRFKRKHEVIPSPERLYGAHWSMADPKIAMIRRIKRKERLSRRNLETGMGFQNFHITEEQIREECERHLEDPLLF
jgi:hypothetical protein